MFIWDKNEACPGHFLSLFEPISQVRSFTFMRCTWYLYVHTYNTSYISYHTLYIPHYTRHHIIHHTTPILNVLYTILYYYPRWYLPRTPLATF
ncbi:hypothetical protein EON63_07585 [archaeon]|nr:MAG: hypothetical protein EON63_07585 [archaeon]